MAKRGPKFWEDRAKVRSKRVYIRVNDREYEAIKAAALKNGRGVAEHVRVESMKS